ncbi:glycosyltransferase family 4 protein [Singulisphaera sp. Ch08]|uniref:Glycosyltransferase family 4 protein n=1 Tax=Singulisphaera sp. Ch08 TaxID=3120278 RepID=A0AAU7CQZ5_9BACT
MRLVVYSHKPCWPSACSPSGFATDGGFPFQMAALSELFESTCLVVPCSPPEDRVGGAPLVGHHLSVVPLSPMLGRGIMRKLGFPFWALGNGRTILKSFGLADAIHTPIPGDVGTVGMVLAAVGGKRLFVRHCGDWSRRKTVAELFWRWFIESFADRRNLMLATGGADLPPSASNHEIQWIFSTSLRESELVGCGVVHEPPEDGRARLIIACRQEREKGTGVVLESLPLILNDFPRATLDVVGDGGALVGLREQARSLGLNGCVTFHGKVDHDRVTDLFRGADLFCYPTSASEGFPKVVLEALACGVPVVTTRVSVLPRLIEQGGGVLIEEATPAAVASAVKTCLSHAESYRDLSRRAVQTASRYSLERWRDTIGDLLRERWGPLRAHD